MTRPLVLVLEDGHQHVTLLRLALMQRGYAVAVARDGERARLVAEGQPVDALVVALPLDAAAAALRTIGEARPRVALVLTDTDASDDARGAGFDAALARPIDFAELDALLRTGLASRRSGTHARVRVPPKGDVGAA
jgi:DNA-binding response OmpR family regulator